mgnify:CR=1 FL=1
MKLLFPVKLQLIFFLLIFCLLIASPLSAFAGCCKITPIANERGLIKGSIRACKPFLAYCKSEYSETATLNSSNDDCIKSSTSTPSSGVGTGAGAGVNPKIISITNPLNSNSIPGLIGNIITWLLKIIGALALALFFYGGFQWLTSAGNDKKVSAGKDTLFWASVGLLCVFLSYIAVGFVLEVIGVI